MLELRAQDKDYFITQLVECHVTVDVMGSSPIKIAKSSNVKGYFETLAQCRAFDL